MGRSLTLSSVAVMFSLVGYFWYWYVRLAGAVVLSAPARRSTSFVLLTVPQLVTALFYEGRDASQLLTSGLSRQNIAQASTLMLLGAWALWIVYAKRVRLSGLVAGPMFWIGLLLAAYWASSTWSVWPDLTVFRAAELTIYALVSLHIFSSDDWSRWLEKISTLQWR
jgi:hypothetical protein